MSPSTSPWRNRDFALLQAGRLFSTTGTQLSTFAYPLLALAITGSPMVAGLVVGASYVAYPVLGPFAGLVADRISRRAIMITADVLRVLALGTLGIVVVAGHPTWWIMLAVALVESCSGVFFSAAEVGALRAVVPRDQIPAAAGAEQARAAVVRLVGPPLGGVLYGVGRAVPFLADAISYLASLLSLVALGMPFQQQHQSTDLPVRRQLVEGFAYLFRHPFLRTCSLIFALGNLVFPGLQMVLVVSATQHGLSSGRLGALIAAFGVATLLGALASSVLQRRLSVRAILLTELWTWPATAAFLIWPHPYVLAAGLMVQGFTLPVTDSVVIGYRTAVVPDAVLGRVDSAARSISMSVMPLGPVLAGVLLSVFGAWGAMACLSALGAGLALWGSVSSAIRSAPSLRTGLEVGDASTVTT
ncbi:MAG: transporter [Actinomycetota bacterium]|nr:transporter [Actinomycetota bacterium]